MITNLLFVQDSAPCIRTIKIADALNKSGINIHLIHRNLTPDEVYGFGNSSFESLTNLPKYRFNDLRIIKAIIKEKNIQLIHFHNQPDQLGAKLITANIGIPIIYDQHDFMSFKHHLTTKKKKDERICNELADGTIYITGSYKKEVSKFYQLINNSICFGNYFSENNALNPNQILPKLSFQDNKCHLVYIGRISENKTDHRNIIDILKEILKNEFLIHIYPSTNKKYRNYNSIKNVIVHEKLNYRALIKEISQYDFGITVFNNRIASKLPHIKYAFGNKTYDYLCAGLPVVVQDCLDDVRNFVIKNNFGFILENYRDYKNMSSTKYSGVFKKIIQNRSIFSIENQIHRIVDFYKKTLHEFYKNS